MKYSGSLYLQKSRKREGDSKTTWASDGIFPCFYLLQGGGGALSIRYIWVSDIQKYPEHQTDKTFCPFCTNWTHKYTSSILVTGKTNGEHEQNALKGGRWSIKCFLKRAWTTGGWGRLAASDWNTNTLFLSRHLPLLLVLFSLPRPSLNFPFPFSLLFAVQ